MEMMFEKQRESLQSFCDDITAKSGRRRFEVLPKGHIYGVSSYIVYDFDLKDWVYVGDYNSVSSFLAGLVFGISITH